MTWRKTHGKENPITGVKKMSTRLIHKPYEFSPEFARIAVNGCLGFYRFRGQRSYHSCRFLYLFLYFCIFFLGEGVGKLLKMHFLSFMHITLHYLNDPRWWNVCGGGLALAKQKAGRKARLAENPAAHMACPAEKVVQVYQLKKMHVVLGWVAKAFNSLTWLIERLEKIFPHKTSSLSHGTYQGID